MIEKLKELNETLPGILIADIIYLIIGEIIIAAFIPEPHIYMIGFFIGVLYAVFCVFHMSFDIRRVVYGKADSRMTMFSGYFLRLLVLLVLLAILYIFNIGDLLSTLIGAFSMKLSAYAQPYVNRIISKILKKGG